MKGLAVLHRLGSLAPVEEAGGVVVKVCSVAPERPARGVAPAAGEEVNGVALPSSGEVYALGSVVALAVAALHEHHFVSVVQLRYAAEGRHKGYCKLHLVRIALDDVARARMVVVGEEYHHVVQVVIDEILGQDAIDAGHALVPPYLVLAEGGDYGVTQREVHDAGEVAVVAVLVGVAALPVCDLGNERIPAFAHYVDAGVLLAHGLAPLRHGARLVVRECVNAQSVQVGIFHPPDGPLLEVLEYERIVEVHVRHGGHEPAALLTGEVGLRRMGIHIDGEQGVHLHVLGETVDPVLERGVLHPPVSGAAMVGDDVHYDLEACLVRLCHIFLIQGVVSEARVDVVIVGACVSVIRFHFLVVEQQGGVPDCRGAQIDYVIKMVDEALYVSAVAGYGIFAVNGVRGLGDLPLNSGAVVVCAARPAAVVV